MGSKLNLYVDGTPLTASHFSGVGHYALGVIRGLDSILSNNKHVQAYIVIPSDKKELLDSYRLKNFTVKYLPMNSEEFQSHWISGSLPMMDSFIGKGVYFFPNFVTWPLKYSASITTIHDLSFEEVPQFVDDGNAKFLSKAVSKSVSATDCIATVTETMKDVIANFYSVTADKIIVTNNAVDMKHFSKRPNTDVDIVKRKYGISGDYILCIGNIEPRKNHKNLLRAFQALPDNISRVYTLVLVGAGGWKNEPIHRLAAKLEKENKHVKIVEGKVTDEDMPFIYSGATLSINPSFYEGFGMPTVEAMACRVPVIVSDIPVMKEVAGPDSIYVDPHSIESIKEGMVQALALPGVRKEAMIERNYDKAKAYTWKHAANVLLDRALSLNIPQPKRTVARRIAQFIKGM